MQTDVIRRISIEATQKGVAETTAGLKGLAAAQDGVTVASDKSTKSQLSVASAYERQQRSLDVNYRSTQQFEKAQRTLDQALQQGIATGTRHAELSALNATRYDQQSTAAKAFGVITQDLSGRVQASAGSFGVAGQALTALGPAGLAAAAAIGLLGTAFYMASAGAHELAQKSRELKDFSEATGLTVNQVQALRSEATKFGVDSDTLQAGLQKFTTGFQELRLGSGDLLTQIRRINPALADQMAVATDTATAFTLYGQAVAQTTNIFERNALARAGLGKGGPTVAEFLGKVGDVNALTSAYDAAGKGLQKNMIDKLAELDLQISKTSGKARENFSSIFAQPVLEAELGFAKVFLQISETAKNFQLSEGAKTLFGAIYRANPLTGPIIALFSAASAIRSTAVHDNSAAALAVSDAVPRGRTYDQITASGQPGATSQPGETVESVAAKWKNYVAVLGAAATPTERLNASIAELGVKAKEAGVGADVLARGVAGLRLDAAISQQSAHNSALGAAASVTDILKAKTLELAKAQEQGAGLTKEQIANAKAVAAAQALGTYQIQSQIDGEKIRTATIFIGAEASLSYATSQAIINKAIQDGKPLSADEITQIRAKADELAKLTIANNRLADAVQTAKDAGQDFAKSFVSGLMQGKSGMDALTAAAGNLASKMADKALTDLFSGNFLQAGVEAVIAVGAQLFSNSGKKEKELQEAQVNWQKMAGALDDFNRAAKGFTLGPLASQIADLASKSSDLQQAALKAKQNGAAAQIGQEFNQAVVRIVGEFEQGAVKLSPLAQAMKAVNDEARGLHEELARLNLGGAGLNIDASAAAQIKNIIAQFTSQLTSSLTERLNTAQGKGYLNDAASLLKQRQADLASAAELGNDPAIISQIYATFAAQAQALVKDSDLAGDSFNDLIQMFPDFAGVVTQSTTAIDAANEKFAAFTKTINDYLASLQVGANSILSPQDQLASAQDQFNRQLGLAAGGDEAAQGSITQYASTLLDQAKSYYASSSGYADVYKAVTAALGGLVGSTAVSSGGTASLSAVTASGNLSGIVPTVSAPRAGASNDNGQLFATQTQTLVQAIASAISAQILADKDNTGDLATRLDRIAKAVESRSRATRPADRAAA